MLLEVADTGTGMDEATQTRVLEPFFTTKERGKGTGLGLSTVYGIVAQSGGHIRLESAPGRGTTFRIYLPSADAAERDAAASPPAEESAPRGDGTVLLVEDEDEVRLLVREVLESGGYTVLAAAGGDEALRLAAAHPGAIDVLLTDVVMPGMSGPEVAQRLRELRPDAMVVFMSGYADHPAVHQVTSGAAHRFLQKPFTPKALLRGVRMALDRRG